LLRQSLIKKSEKVKRVKKIIQKYRVFGIASLQKVRASQLQEIRKKLETKAYISVIKNSLMKRAIETCEEKPNIKKMKEFLTGSNLFLFTDFNIFKLIFILNKSRIKAFAKVGDVATEDVIVPAGNTGFPPGPMISHLGSVGISTKIQNGSVWINKNTVVAKEGEVISENLAPVLSKLGIKPVELGLSLKVAFNDGIIILKEDLNLRIETYEANIVEAYKRAFAISLEATYPIVENISLIIRNAFKEAYGIALKANVLSKETIVDLIRKGNSEILLLQSKIQTKK
jgi:large subunit ribosomal protein L10